MRSFIICVALLLSPLRASADRAAIEAGLAAFEALDYPRAVALLNQAFTEALSIDEKVIVLRTLAFAHVALDEPDQARAEFRLLLRIDPKSSLDATISPRTRLVFEEALSELGRVQSLEPPPSPAAAAAAAPKPSLPPLTDAPPNPRRPLWRKGWVWGTAAGAAATIILTGVLAGVLSEPSTVRVTVARP